MATANDFVEIKTAQVPKGPEGQVLVDLYILLPNQQRYIVFVRQNETWDDDKVAKLETHAIPKLYSLKSDQSKLVQETTVNNTFNTTANNPEFAILGDLEPISQEESMKTTVFIQSNYSNVLSKEDAAKAAELLNEIKIFHSSNVIDSERTVIHGGSAGNPSVDAALTPEAVFKYIAQPEPNIFTELRTNLLEADPEKSKEIANKMKDASDSIVQFFSPIALKDKDPGPVLLKRIAYMPLFNETVRTCALAICAAYTSGFASRKTFQEIFYASLLMDVPLEKFTKEDRLLYYTNPEALQPETLKNMRNHPQLAFDLCNRKLPIVNDISKQMILTHHELYSGKGFPRGVRSEGLAKICPVFAFAADVSDLKKKEELLGQETTLTEVLYTMLEDGIDAHARRHKRQLVVDVCKFVGGAL